MNYHLLYYSFLLLSTGAMAQPFDVAPRTTKKVHKITEWISPDVNAKSEKGMVSTFDQRGNLIAYTSEEEFEVLNTTYTLDRKGRVVETLEGKGSDRIKTTFEYHKDHQIKMMSFRGKVNRIIDFLDKKGKRIERKAYSKGLELGNTFRLKEQIFYVYNAREQLITEHCRTYNLPNSNDFSSRKKVYHYHPQRQYLIKMVQFDYDESVSVIEDYAYYADGQLKTVITTFVKDGTVSTKELLYKNNHLWQRITTERGLRHVEIFVEGRLIRLRSYNENKIYRVVDYQYEYY